VLGIFTDGDLRRLIETGRDLRRCRRPGHARLAAHHQPKRAGRGRPPS
jgi:hypothetical protein